MSLTVKPLSMSDRPVGTSCAALGAGGLLISSALKVFGRMGWRRYGALGGCSTVLLGASTLGIRAKSFDDNLVKEGTVFTKVVLEKSLQKHPEIKKYKAYLVFHMFDDSAKNKVLGRVAIWDSERETAMQTAERLFNGIGKIYQSGTYLWFEGVMIGEPKLEPDQTAFPVFFEVFYVYPSKQTPLKTFQVDKREEMVSHTSPDRAREHLSKLKGMYGWAREFQEKPLVSVVDSSGKFTDEAFERYGESPGPRPI